MTTKTRTRWMLTAVLCILPLAGCNMGTSAHYNVGSYAVDVDGCAGSNSITQTGTTINTDGKSTTSKGSTAEIGCGDTKITIADDSLTVNSKDYGKLVTADKIRVSSGLVFVNDAERKPAN